MNTNTKIFCASVVALAVSACASPGRYETPRAPAAPVPVVNAKPAPEAVAVKPMAEPPAPPAPVAKPAPSAAAVGAGLIKPLVDRRDTITATGYAVIGVQNAKTPPQQRLLAIRAAKIDAYRSLAEQVYGLYLDSTTTIADMTVLSDRFRTRVEGVIYGATLSSITPVNNDTYEVTLTLDTTVVSDLRLLYLEHVSKKR